MDADSIDLETCRLRQLRIEDAPSIAHHANDREVWLNLRDRFPHPYTVDDARDWIGHGLATDPATDFAIEVGGEAIGAIGIARGEDVHRRTAEVGYWLGRTFWGRGVATAAVRALTAHALENFDLIRIQASVFGWNLASARVLEKAGYAREGRLRNAVTKDGRTTDELVYAIVRG